MQPVDSSLAKLRELKPEILKELSEANTEADTRLRAIDRILIEVLGWPRTSMSLEPTTSEGRLDYLLSTNAMPRLVVEAKYRDAFSFPDMHRSGQPYKILGAVYSQKLVIAAIRQAAAYTKSKHVALCAVTNGADWIVLLGNRTDGMAFDEGYAFLFHGLDSIEKHFADFFSLLHHSAVERLAFRDLFEDAEKGLANHFQFSQPVRKASLIQRHARSERATDIERICQHFFRDIVNPNDPEMLSKCFIDTRESRQADAKLLRITQHLSAQVETLGPSHDPLIRTIEDTLKTKHEETVLLVGGKGSGKSTFMTRFFEMALPPELRTACILHRLDLAKAQRDPQSLHRWLNDALLKEVDAQQLALGATTAEHIQGVFFSEYRRWSERSHAHLYEKDKELFKIRFEEHIEELRNDGPLDYISAFLGDIARNRKKLPVLLFDNVDHHLPEIQEAVFQYALSFSRREDIPAILIILPVTVRTLWQLSRESSFESTFTSRFYLPPPPIPEVLKRRLAFIHDKIELGRKSHSADYFLSQSIKVSLEGLAHFVAHIQEALIASPVASRTLELLSNGDIRRLLDLTYALMSSPYLKIGELFTSYVTSEPLRIGRSDLMKALIRRDCLSFKRDENAYVINLFEVVPGLYTSPLLPVRILTYLKERYQAASDRSDPQARDVSIDEYTSFFLQIGVRQKELAQTTSALLEYGLLESQDPTTITFETAQIIAITSAGIAHLEWALANDIYVEAMSEVTTIHRSDTHTILKAAFEEKPIPNVGLIKKAFSSYCQDLDKSLYQVPASESYRTQLSLGDRISQSWA